MFAKTRKEKFVEQAQDLAQDLTDAITPHVEKARDELAPRLADARDTIAPKLADARDTVAPKLADARDTIAPKLADARDQAAPYVESARDRIVNEVVPAVQQALTDARDQAAPVADEAKRRGSLAAAALKGEPVKKKGGKKKYFVLAALAGLGAYVAQKMRGGNESANWQTSYSPKPAPAAPPAPPSPAAPMAGSHAADAAVDSSATSAGDPTGASPGETLSDATEQPHPVTTPDAPADDVDVSDVQDPKKP
jgi:F0F1-type ATP synthase membrane subunit b/b'